MQKARIALLNHYSSKSTNQATIILTLVIALFAFIEASRFIALPLNIFRILYYSFFLTIWLFFTVRAIRKLIWWGEMAGYIGSVEMINVERAEKEVGEEKKNFGNATFLPTYLMRLDKACQDAFTTWCPKPSLYHILRKVLLHTTKTPYRHVIFPAIFLVFSLHHRSQTSLPFLECILFWVIFAIACLIFIYGCIYVLKDIAHFVKCALVRTETYVNIKIHDVPAKLVKDFNEYVVKPHYSGGIS